MLEFACATGLRASELVGATLGAIETDARQESWLHLVGKGAKAGKVALPPLALTALERYLVQRALPVTPTRWGPDTPLVGRLADEAGGITTARLWALMRRFFATAAGVVERDNPPLAEKLRRAGIGPRMDGLTTGVHIAGRAGGGGGSEIGPGRG